MERRSHTTSSCLDLQRGTLALTCALAATLALPASLAAQTVTLTVGSAADGLTPRVIGYNAHSLGVRDMSWVEHSDINGMRFWLDVDTQSAMAIDNQASTRLAFINLRMDTRSEINNGPLGNTTAANCSASLEATTPSNYINWSHYLAQYNSKAFTLNEFARLGVEPLVQHSVTQPLAAGSDTSSLSWTYRWQLWRHMFAVAYIAASRWGITTYEIMNEPNIPRESPRAPAPEYVERLRLASDAIQLAIKTVNKRRAYCGSGPALAPKVLAPTLAGGPQIYDPGNEPWITSPQIFTDFNGFYCDPNLTTTNCYGRYVLQNRNTSTFYSFTLASADSFPTLFQGYSYHWYTGTQATYWTGGGPVWRGMQDFQSTWKYFANFPTPTPQLDLYLTETNLMGHGDWATATPDTGILVPQFGRALMYDARANPANPFAANYKNVYVFRLQQAGNKENGLHYIGTSGGQISGATVMAEVTRLFAHGFKGARYRYPVSTTDAKIDALAARDMTDDFTYNVFVTNYDASPRTVTLDMSPWTPIPTSVYVRIDSVAPEQRNLAKYQWMSNRRLTFTVPGYGVSMVSAPYNSASIITETVAAADSTVKGGTNRNANYGTSTNLYAAGSGSSAGAHNAALLRFDVSSTVNWDQIQFAFLKVYGQAKTTSGNVGTEVIAHVYGLDDDAWSETGVTGANAPNIVFPTGGMTSALDSPVTDVGQTAHFVGHFTGHAAAEYLSIDITDYVKRHIGRQLTFLVVREPRFNANTATNNIQNTMTDATRSLWMASRESSTSAQRPRLQLVLRN